MNRLQTRVGMAFWDHHVLFGKDLYRDIVPLGLNQLIPLLVSGRPLAPEDVELFSRWAVCGCITDPHVWPLKVARLGASYGRIVPGVAVGALLQESDRVGGLVTSDTARWLVRLAETTKLVGFEQAARDVLEPLPAVSGFGVPFRDEDERVVALRKIVAELKAEDRSYWKLFEQTSAWMKEHRHVAPNMSAASAAILLDMGMSPEDTGPIAFWLILLTQFANAVEGGRQAPALMRALPESAVRYEGAPPRVSSRATT